jgi:putative flippase GtrA
MAAVVGFASVTLANYTAHEFWTFRSGSSHISWIRALQYLGASGVTLLMRLTVIIFLSRWIGATHSLVILVAAAGVSFSFSFLLSKHLIFSHRFDRDLADK